MDRRALAWVAGSLAAAVGALAGTPALVGTAAALPTSGSGHKTYFVATTSASAAAVAVTQKPASSIITANLVNDSLGYTATAFDSTSGSEAQAASLYPGALVTQGPALLCSEGVLPFACPVTPPAYPLLADATYPQHRHATAAPGNAPGTPKTVSFHPAAATATATATSARGRTGATSGTALPGTSVALSIGSQTSHSTIRTTRNSVTVTVTSRVADVTVGQLLRIGSVTGRVVQRVAAGHRVVDRPSVAVSGLSVAGHAATIGRHGLRVAGHDGPRLVHTLATHGVTVRPVSVTRDDTRRGARSDVTGLTIVTRVPVAKTPYLPNPGASLPVVSSAPGVDLNGTYIATVSLGAAGAAAGVEQQPNLGLGGLAPLPVNPPAASPAGHAPAVRHATGGGRIVHSGGGAAPTVAPSGGSGAAPPQVAPAPRAAAHGFLDGVRLDLSTLYLVLALGTAALFVGWRLRVALRAGGPLRSRLP